MSGSIGRGRADGQNLVTLGTITALFISGIFSRHYLTELTHRYVQDQGLSELLMASLLWILGGVLADTTAKAVIFGRILPRITRHEPPLLLVNLSTTIIFTITLGGCIVTFLDGSVTTLLTTSGVLTVVVGFALRELILDFFCGIAINLERPFKMGDWVEVQKDLVARVVEINWRATHLLTDSHKTVIVPNRMMASKNLVNYSLPESSYRENMKIVLGNEHDPDRIVSILTAAILATPEVIPGAKHRVRLEGFDERGTVWALKFWIAVYSERIPAIHNVYANCIRNLHAAGIEIPYNRSEVIMSGRSLSTVHETARQRNNFTILRRVQLFKALHDAEVQKVADCLSEHDFAADQVVVMQGDAGQSLFVLVEGLLTVSVDDQVVGTIQAGSVFGEMSLLTGEPRKATVMTQTTTVVLEVSAELMHEIMTSRPSIVDDLALIMARNKAVKAVSGSPEASVKGESSLLADKIRSFFHRIHA